MTGDKELGFAPLQQTLSGWGETASGKQLLETGDRAAGALVLKGGARSS